MSIKWRLTGHLNKSWPKRTLLMAVNDGSVVINGDLYLRRDTQGRSCVCERESGTRRELPLKGDKKYDRHIRSAAQRDGVRSRAST